MKDGLFSKDILKIPGKQMRSVWAISTPSSHEKIHGKHPTQKPVALLERIILASTQPGDLVLDPFMGSGTTGVAALKNSRKFVGIEKEKEYFQLAEKRIIEYINLQWMLGLVQDLRSRFLSFGRCGDGDRNFNNLAGMVRYLITNAPYK